MKQDKVTINIAVDVIRALSENSLENSLYLMDDSAADSRNQCTPDLCTACLPGQTVHWVAYALDLQTPVSIRSISFLELSGEDELPDENPGLNTWMAVLPCMETGHRYFYRLSLQMGYGRHSVMSACSPSLVRAYPECCEDETNLKMETL